MKCVLLQGVLVVFVGLMLEGHALAERRDGTLGSRCSSIEDCVPALSCLRPENEVFGIPSVGRGGPSGGLCAAFCATANDCQGVAASAVCVRGVCLESCTRNSAFDEGLDPEKCHGRTDMACSPQCKDASCREVVDACQPVCSSDAECGEERFCNRGTGVCQRFESGKAPLGTACDPWASQETCRGKCVQNEEALLSAGMFTGVCQEICVLGAPDSCGGPGARERSICLGGRRDAETPLAPPESTSGQGDLGTCAAVCDCSRECLESESCERLELGYQLALGICRNGPRSSTAPDCLSSGDESGGASSGCDDGAIRACKNETCLGTSRCEGGQYTPCTCLEPEELAVPELTGRSRPKVSGCSIGSSRSPTIWLCLAALTAVAVARARGRAASYNSALSRSTRKFGT